uniref:Uncharacterized protein n=1 Tax=Micrurus surinamensis TaxID=129470 RepID=A0A2D4PH88_MICSU
MCLLLVQMELHAHACTLTNHSCRISSSPPTTTSPQNQKGRELCHISWKISRSELSGDEEPICSIRMKANMPSPCLLCPRSTKTSLSLLIMPWCRLNSPG